MKVNEGLGGEEAESYSKDAELKVVKAVSLMSSIKQPKHKNIVNQEQNRHL